MHACLSIDSGPPNLMTRVEVSKWWLLLSIRIINLNMDVFFYFPSTNMLGFVRTHTILFYFLGLLWNYKSNCDGILIDEATKGATSFS